MTRRDESTPGIFEAGSAAPLNPLPPGMRDLLPPKAYNQSRVGSRIMRCFELFGYGRVWLPMFEYGKVIERTRSVGSALRFVEPDSGEVVALRADMTPQVARVVSTRYRSAPLPVRLCYQGSVLRRRRERARTESQVVQAGIELVGVAGLDADMEVIRACCSAVRAAGVEHFVLDVGHAGIANALLAPLAAEAREGINEALSAKDTVVLERRGRDAGLGGKELRALVALAELHGDKQLLRHAMGVLGGTSAEACGHELLRLGEHVLDSETADAVVFDFGETNRFDYYTGAMFQVLAAGPGEPLASGGRYDNLYPRFGLERAAAGCALDLNNVCRALETAGWSESTFPRLVASVGVSAALLDALRARQIACTTTDASLEQYANAWGFEFCLASTPLLTVSHSDGSRLTVADAAAPEQARRITEFIQQQRARA